MPLPPWIDDVATAVADGARVDWPATLAKAVTAEERAYLGHLQALEWLSKVHAAPPEPASTQSLHESLLHPSSGVIDDTRPVRWGPLTILEKVGQGRYGDVYRALDPTLDRPVALKLIRRKTREAIESAVIAEGRLLARLRHPHIVTVYGAERLDGRVGLWMEFIDGRTLEEELLERGPLPAEDLAEIARVLTDALTAVHRAGLIHRDLKAQNVMRARDGRLVLTDFGAGLDETDSAGRPGQNLELAGTPLYIAPEVLRGGRPSAASDRYSLGVLLYHLATGDYPIRGESLRQLRERHDAAGPISVASTRPDLPPELVTCINTLLSSDPQQRRLPAAALTAAIRKPQRRLVPAAILLALVVLPVAAWLYGGDDSAPRPFAAGSSQYLIPPLLDLADEFGFAVAVDGDTAVVGAPREDSAAVGINGNSRDNSVADSGAAYVFVRRNGEWTFDSYLKASNTDAGDQFGSAVAISGGYIFVGAVGESSVAQGVNADQSNNAAFETGAVYVFSRRGSTWVQEAYLKASDAGPGDHFGFSLSASGNRLVVGAFKADSGTVGTSDTQLEDSGAAYLFEAVDGVWQEHTRLNPENAGRGDLFGLRVAIDGDTIAVSAVYEDGSASSTPGRYDDAANNAGAVYVFTREGTRWPQRAYLKASNAEARSDFGNGLALSGDRIVVGALAEGSGQSAAQRLAGSGAAYVFEREGTHWTQTAFLKASNADIGDWFGCNVATDGDLIVVGASKEDSGETGADATGINNSLVDAGAAYVFDKSSGVWSQRRYLKPTSSQGLGYFGNFVAMSGRTVLTSAYAAPGARAANQPVAGRAVGTGAVIAWTFDDDRSPRASGAQLR